MDLHVFFHDRCFDGAASAAVFTRLYHDRMNAHADFRYTGLAHRASQLFDENLFDGNENAIVDFKYSTSPHLDWWFDHHQSAFLTPQDAEHFRSDTTGKKFYDPNFKSCTQLIAAIGRKQFGFVADDLRELVYWADVVDGALFPDAAAAVQMKEAALQIALVMEAGKDGEIPRWVIPEMGAKRLEQIASEDRIRAEFEPLYQQHLRSMELIRKLGRCDQGVVFFDLTGPHVEAYNKFAPYYLFPDCIYSVSICPSSFRTKISVGSNPWNRQPVLHNLATICERYGGGGHSRVGAISLEPGQLERAREIANEIVEELKHPPRSA